MKVYTFQFIDEDGQLVSTFIDANSVQEATDIFKNRFPDADIIHAWEDGCLLKVSTSLREIKDTF